MLLVKNARRIEQEVAWLYWDEDFILRYRSANEARVVLFVRSGKLQFE